MATRSGSRPIISLSGFCLLLTVMAFSHDARATTLDFEGLNNGGGTFANIGLYGGLNWGNVLAVNLDSFGGGAFTQYRLNGRDAAAPTLGPTIAVESLPGETFDFNSVQIAYFVSPMSGFHNMTIRGWEDRNSLIPTFEQVFAVTTVYDLYSFNLPNLEKLALSHNGPSSEFFFIEDFTFNEIQAAPEPAPVGMLLGLAFGYVVRSGVKTQATPTPTR